MRAEDFLSLMQGKDQAASFRIGTIPMSYTSGRPAIQFDGETTASVRTYPYMSSYTPTAGDRVLIGMVGHSGVILGKIV